MNLPAASQLSSRAPERLSTREYRELIARGAVDQVCVKRAAPEEDLQRACMDWVFLNTARYPKLKFMVHVPNGGKRPKGEAGKLKAMGCRAGYPDLTLPRRHLRYFGLAMELKSPTGSVSAEQRVWLDGFADDGWLVAVIRSLDDFIAVTTLFLEGREVSSQPYIWRPTRL